ncbi:hypothetical protein E4K10_38920 [Streptomyces sp. T1317-0309]|nr:hypothetical protein E4K10_38920 [Streptomyces sp. T1317-0309]
MAHVGDELGAPRLLFRGGAAGLQGAMRRAEDPNGAELKTYRAYVAHVSCCGQCGPRRCPVGAALCRAYLKEVNSLR